MIKVKTSTLLIDINEFAQRVIEADELLVFDEHNVCDLFNEAELVRIVKSMAQVYLCTIENNESMKELFESIDEKTQSAT